MPMNGWTRLNFTLARHLAHGGSTYTAHGHKLRFSIIPACFWRESNNPTGALHRTLALPQGKCVSV
jgi:hypothetical protein